MPFCRPIGWIHEIPIPSSISTIQLSDLKSLVDDSPAAAELMISFTKTENFQIKKPKK